MTNSKATLNVQIRKRFDSPTHGFELEIATAIAPGITVIFGPSGAGKTTLLECIAGLLTPTSGEVRIGDQVFFDSSRNIDTEVRKRRIGYVFQDLALFPHLTVERNIGYGIRNLSVAEREKRIGTILSSFRIAGLRHRKPTEISGGERQRVALARSLVTDPVVLMLDEPLAALDGATKSRLIEDLRSWNDAHRIPILYVTHSREEVVDLGRRVLTLDAGKVILEGALAPNCGTADKAKPLLRGC